MFAHNTTTQLLKFLPTKAALSLVALLVCATLSPAYANEGLTSMDDLALGLPTAPLADETTLAAAPNNNSQLAKLGPQAGGNQPTPSAQAQAIQSLTSAIGALEQNIQLLSQNKANDKDVKALQATQKRLIQELTNVTNQLATAASKNTEQDARLNLLEKVQIHGDMTAGVLSDMNRNSVGDNGSGGIEDAISAIGRLRLTVDVPVVEANDEKKLGTGTVSTRLIAAYGRYGPVGNNGNPNSGANYPFNLYSRVAADVSAFNEGFGTGSVGANGGGGVLNGQNGNTSMTRPNLFLESAFYKQEFKDGIPLLTDIPGFGGSVGKEGFETTGKLYAGLVRWWDLFDVSPYRGDENSQFQNNAFVNVPGVAVNVAMPMVGYQWHQGLGSSLSSDVGVGLGSIDVGDLMDGLNLTYEAKLNYVPTFLPEALHKPGSVYAGAYHIFLAGNRNFNESIQANLNYTKRNGNTYNPDFNQDTHSAIYAGWNQEWWRGIGTTFSYLYNQSGVTPVLFTTQQPGPANVAAGAKSAFHGVVSVPMSVFGDKIRPQDTIGLGYAFVNIQDGGTQGAAGFSNVAMEHVLEAYYRFRVNDAFSIMPSIQMIVNPLGLTQNGTTTALGCRLNYTF